MTYYSDPKMAKLDADAQRIVGKPLGDCEVADLQCIIQTIGLETAVMVAEGDRADAAIAEAKRCGCPIRAPRRPNGSTDIGRAVVVHRQSCSENAGASA